MTIVISAKKIDINLKYQLNGIDNNSLTYFCVSSSLILPELSKIADQLFLL